MFDLYRESVLEAEKDLEMDGMTVPYSVKVLRATDCNAAIHLRVIKVVIFMYVLQFKKIPKSDLPYGFLRSSLSCNSHNIVSF